MSLFNSVIGALFDGFFGLFGMLGGDAALWIFSALAGVLFLWIFKLTSNQAAIRRTKDRIAARFLEVRLFKDDMRQMLRSQGRIFGSAFGYMGHALKPMAFMIIPVLLMLIQLNLWYGFTGIPVESSTVVRAKISGEQPPSERTISLKASEGLAIETPALRIDSLREANWRVKTLSPGEHTLTLTVDGQSVEHVVQVGDDGKFRKIEPVRAGGAWELLWNPGMAALPAEASVAEFSVDYPEAEANLLGFKMHWVIVFLILSIVFGFAFKGVLGVEI